MKWLAALRDLSVIIHTVRQKPTLVASESPPFFFNPEYKDYRPGKPLILKRKSTRFSIVGVLLVSLMLAFIGLMCLSLFSRVRENALLEQKGTHIQALVTKCEGTKSGRPSITYTYPAGHPPHVFTREDLGPYYQTCVATGSRIDVQYLPDDPSQARIAEPGLISDDADRSLLLIVTFTGFLPLFLLLISGILTYSREVRRFYLYKRYGRVLPGVITEA
jgi:hypothetical protein